jgi:hypothetical protein
MIGRTMKRTLIALVIVVSPVTPACAAGPTPAPRILYTDVTDQFTLMYPLSSTILTSRPSRVELIKNPNDFNNTIVKSMQQLHDFALSYLRPRIGKELKEPAW